MQAHGVDGRLSRAGVRGRSGWAVSFGRPAGGTGRRVRVQSGPKRRTQSRARRNAEPGDWLWLRQDKRGRLLHTHPLALGPRPGEAVGWDRGAHLGQAGLAAGSHA